jgi:hypothetical protein
VAAAEARAKAMMDRRKANNAELMGQDRFANE